MTRFRPCTARAILPALALAAILPWSSARGQADNFPVKPITIIVPSAAGATATQIRMLAPCLSTALGDASVMVENRPGAGGAIGAAAVKNARADGYTLLFIGTPVMSILPHLAPVTYKLADFTAVGNLTATPMLMAARPGAPYKTFAEFLRYAKANPSAVNFASAGVGTSMHVTGEELQAVAGLDFVHVPYAGGVPAVQALLSGVADIVIGPPALLNAMISAGRLRPLVVFGDARYRNYPDIPIAREFGIDVVENLRSGLLAPGDVPKPVLGKLVNAFRAAISDSRCVGSMRQAEIDVQYLAPADFQQELRVQVERYNKLFATAKFASRVK